MKIGAYVVAGLLLLAGCTEAPPPPLMGDPLNPSAIAFFAFDSAELTPQGLSSLRAFAQAAKTAKGGGRVFVCGHADKVGTAEANLAISQKRVDVVRQALIELGLPADLIVVSAKGDTRPLVGNEGAEAQNRRVDVNFEHPLGLGGQQCSIR